MVKFAPLGERVVIKPLERDEVSKGGIILPDTAKEKPQEDEVVEVGPGRVAQQKPALLLKGCPKCGGDLSVARDIYGRYVSCLQCGLVKDVQETRGKP